MNGGLYSRLVASLIDRAPVTVLGIAALVVFGLIVSPFLEDAGPLPHSPVAVDALPNVGQNQQIVTADWPGRSPRDVEDGVTYPLTTALLGAAGVKTIRSSSMMGRATLFVVFEEDMGFYESRARLLEKLASLPADLLPPEVSPALGPDATPLGQVYQYKLVGRSPDGETVGGWGLQELRTIQDDTVRFALQSVPGVSEVASVGGFVEEVQVDVDPDALDAARVSLTDVAKAVGSVSSDEGLRTMEINRVEYVVRSEGSARGVDDVREAVIALRDGVPLRVRDVAHVHLGPAERRGALDDAGAEVVGGIVTVRQQANPRQVIERVKARVSELQGTLPTRSLEDGTESRVTIVPFYDRTGLIQETLGTLSSAVAQQLLITIIVVLVFMRRVGESLLVSALLPLGVAGALISMRLFGVGAHIMALSGIAIAIGTMVDMGIVLSENISSALEHRRDGQGRRAVVTEAAAEVAPAILTSTLTTVVSFLPVFALTQEEGRMFRPLALTKTFAVVSALILAALAIPPVASLVLGRGRPRPRVQRVVLLGLIAAAGILLTRAWNPLGPPGGFLGNLLFVGLMLFLIIGGLHLFMRAYPVLLEACLRHPWRFGLVPGAVVVTGLMVWLGAPVQRLPEPLAESRGASVLADAFPGLGQEYMPPFDEGSFLVMPTTMPHASIGEALRLLQQMDARIAAIPEVDEVVGKLGRAETALDPAPISMFETLVTYVPEFGVGADGERVRQWRDEIRGPDDLWREIREAAAIPGLTGAPRLQPIETRQVMLQSGMRSPLGLKVQGPKLEDLESFGRSLEEALRRVDVIQPGSVFADRVVGKPYLVVRFDRTALARHGLNVGDVQRFLRLAVGGAPVARTLDGRTRRDIRVRYMSEERSSPDALQTLRIDTPSGGRIPLSAVASLEYERGPQSIRSEDGFLTTYVTFDGRAGVASSEVVARAKAALDQAQRDGTLRPPSGVRWSFAGTYEAQLRSERRLAFLVPLTLVIVFFLLYLQFRSALTALMVASGVLVAMSGGFILLGLYGAEWFLAVDVVGTSLRDLFQIEPINMSVAVWVGFIALVGIATDDGVVMATFLDQSYEREPPSSAEEIRARTLEAASRRLRPCLMTTGTTFIALLPVVMSTGRGADLVRPMAVPILGGMAIELLTLFVVPVLYASRARWRLRLSGEA